MTVGKVPRIKRTFIVEASIPFDRWNFAVVCGTGAFSYNVSCNSVVCHFQIRGDVYM